MGCSEIEHHQEYFDQLQLLQLLRFYAVVSDSVSMKTGSNSNNYLVHWKDSQGKHTSYELQDDEHVYTTCALAYTAAMHTIELLIAIDTMPCCTLLILIVYWLLVCKVCLPLVEKYISNLLDISDSV